VTLSGFQGSRPLDHSGGRTIWKMVGTVEGMQEIKGSLESKGITVKVFSEGQTPEQDLTRQRQLAMGKPDYVWRTAQCHRCFFLNPAIESTCNLMDWDEGVVSAALAVPEAKYDAESCPNRTGPQ